VNKRILIGEIATAHGIKGFVKVRCFADDPGLLESGPLFLGESGDKTLTLSLKHSTDKAFVAEVKGIDDRNDAEKLRGTKLYIDRDSLPEAGDNEYYYEDLKGMNVIDKEGAPMGVVINVTNFGAGDLLDIQKPGSAETFYLPFNGETIIDVAMNSKTITATLPEGWEE
jgi:16S rRNA processing protein RimM